MIVPPLCPEPPEWPAIVQAIGSLVGIAIAILIPMWQRSSALADGKRSDARRQKANRRRISSALISEIKQAIGTSQRQEEGWRKMLHSVDTARANEITVGDPGPLNPRAALITDAVVYHQAATAIGDLPEAITSAVIQFYSAASEVVRVAEIGGQFEPTVRELCDLAPRLRMFGEMARLSMKKWQDADYSDGARVDVSPEEIKAIAIKVGYPLERLMQEREV